MHLPLATQRAASALSSKYHFLELSARTEGQAPEAGPQHSHRHRRKVTMQVGTGLAGRELVQVWSPGQHSLTSLPFLEPPVLLGISAASVLQDVTRKHV